MDEKPSLQNGHQLAIRGLAHLLGVVLLTITHIYLWRCVIGGFAGWYLAALIILNFGLLCFMHFTLSFLMHEAAHRHVSKNRWLNELIFVATGFVSHGSPALYRAIHYFHHGLTNSPNDIEMLPDSNLSKNLHSRRRQILKLVFLGGIERGSYQFGLLLSKKSLKKMKKSDRRRALCETYLTLGLHAMLAVGWTAEFGFLSWLSGLFLPVLIKTWAIGWHQMCEHYGMGPGDALETTRNVIPTTRWGKLYCWMLFDVNFHGVHHAWPYVPANGLAAAHERWTQNLRADGKKPLVYNSYLEVARREVIPCIVADFRAESSGYR